jgi:hypothetical protein
MLFTLLRIFVLIKVTKKEESRRIVVEPIPRIVMRSKLLIPERISKIVTG